MDKLAHLFEEELKDKMLRAKKECKYNPKIGRAHV